MTIFSFIIHYSCIQKSDCFPVTILLSFENRQSVWRTNLENMLIPKLIPSLISDLLQYLGGTTISSSTNGSPRFSTPKVPLTLYNISCCFFPLSTESVILDTITLPVGFCVFSCFRFGLSRAVHSDDCQLDCGVKSWSHVSSIITYMYIKIRVYYCSYCLQVDCELAPQAPFISFAYQLKR